MPYSSPPSVRRVVIIGGGVSGVAVAIQLLRRGGRDLRLTLVERGKAIGRGVAYGVESAVFRLNVPAARMSIDPEKPNDFVVWAGADATPDAFLPRASYGQYVEDRLREAVHASASNLCIAHGEASRIDEGAVVLADGTRLAADVVVLATGITQDLGSVSLPDDARVIDAWNEREFATIPASGKLLLVGAGLTALDVIGLLESRAFSGHATVVSRRGLLPCAHLSPLGPAAPIAPHLVAHLPSDLRSLIAWGREVVREAIAQGNAWQQGIDAMRPYVGRLWRRLPPADRARFVRSVRPYWDVLRHRAPPDMLALVEAWRARGKLDLVRGSVSDCEASPGGLLVDIRQAGAFRRTSFDAVIRCTGPAIARADAEASAGTNLMDSLRAARDPAGLGISTDEEGRVMSPSGEADPRLFAIGAPLRASGWETTSVPEISVCALAIAKRIMSSTSDARDDRGGA